MYICMFIRVYIRVSRKRATVPKNVYVRVCMYVRVCVWVGVCVNSCVYVYLHTHAVKNPKLPEHLFLCVYFRYSNVYACVCVCVWGVGAEYLYANTCVGVCICFFYVCLHV
jgi:hypothetical protein